MEELFNTLVEHIVFGRKLRRPKKTKKVITVRNYGKMTRALYRELPEQQAMEAFRIIAKYIKER